MSLLMLRCMALKGASLAIPLDVLQKVQFFLRDATMLHITRMITTQILKSSMPTLTTGETLDC